MPSDTVPALEERIEAIDLPIELLTPVRKRTVKKQMFARLEANIKAVGLIEPLLIFRQGKEHFILDGYLRYLVLQGMGARNVPCLLIDNLDFYTPNRQVNYLSRSQCWGMLKQAMKDVDEETIKAALAISRLRSEFTSAEREMLCKEVIDRVEREEMAFSVAKILVHVVHDRQRAILELVDHAKDNSMAFIRAQILRTPVDQRVQRPGKKGPWNRGIETRKRLVDRLNDAEKRHEFFEGMYQQYAADLVKLAIHVRQIINVKEIKAYLAQNNGDDLKSLAAIVQQLGEKTGRA